MLGRNEQWSGAIMYAEFETGSHALFNGIIKPSNLGGAKGKTKARLANRGWFDDLTHI